MKTVLITGGTGDIGEATVREFALLKYRVLFTYNTDFTGAEALERKTGAKGYKCDVSVLENVEAVFSQIEKEFSAVDTLINNAGVQLIKMVCDTSDAEWQNVLSVNLTGAFNCSKRALKTMMWSGGRIINVSSVWGQCGGACEAAYSASKAGLIGLTKAMAKEYPSINVNCVAPGVIEGKMNAHLTESEQEELKNEIPLKRFGKPADVAKLCAFLASDDASYITGQVIAVNGGMYI